MTVSDFQRHFPFSLLQELQEHELLSRTYNVELKKRHRSFPLVESGLIEPQFAFRKENGQCQRFSRLD